ncbi:MAG: HAMP domain-containing histidine kinase, partial [Alphaproteobacteria bacterium]|nr:HAMP domain-containing histidine kinase [Alphaproteobacteria bacterium]
MHTRHTIEQQTNRKHLRQLIHLRTVAILGQLATILLVHYGMEIPLPLTPMLGVIAAISFLNIVSLSGLYRSQNISVTVLFLSMLCDVAALTAQVHLSGGSANPFISLFLLQVILGALMLSTQYAWMLMTLTVVAYSLLLFLPPAYALIPPPSALYTQGAWFNYLLAAVLAVWFLTRISHTLKERETSFARLKQQQAEEEHIVRIGLLASGAAHELSTPLSTLSVILNDWQGTELTQEQRDGDIALMQAELQRCKKILSDILLSAGEVRGEGAVVMALDDFMDEVAENWNAARHPDHFAYTHPDGQSLSIVSDQVFARMIGSLLDNAYDASPQWVGMEWDVEDDHLVITVRDKGAGFPADVIDRLGHPFMSTKGTGRGMGLFLTHNTLRKLGGRLDVQNLATGAEVTIRLPLAA